MNAFSGIEYNKLNNSSPHSLNKQIPRIACTSSEEVYDWDYLKIANSDTKTTNRNDLSSLNKPISNIEVSNFIDESKFSFETLFYILKDKHPKLRKQAINKKIVKKCLNLIVNGC